MWGNTVLFFAMYRFLTGALKNKFPTMKKITYVFTFKYI